MQREAGDSGNEDITVESFKDLFNGLSNNYCAHFGTDRFKSVFHRKIDTLSELKKTLDQKISVVNSNRTEINQLQTSITSSLQSVRRNDEEIKKKLAGIKSKIAAITCPYPDDYVLNTFVDDLAKRIKDRQLQIGAVEMKHRRAQNFDEEMRKSMIVPNSINERAMQHCNDFIRQSKPKIDEMATEVSKLRLETTSN